MSTSFPIPRSNQSTFSSWYISKPFKLPNTNPLIPCILLLSLKSASAFNVSLSPGFLQYNLMFSSKYQLSFSSRTVNIRTNSRSTSLLWSDPSFSFPWGDENYVSNATTVTAPLLVQYMSRASEPDLLV